jgi:prepilin-type N-terminal cleavage/methylation domain-containing protein
MKKNKRRWNQKGFTLIESIITLVLVSIMAVMLLTFSQPLNSSLGAFSWFNDELLLQQSMEKILGDYKSQRNNPYNPFDPSAFRTYVINNNNLLYKGVVDATRTGFLTFTCSGTAPNIICTAAWPPQVNTPTGIVPPVLIITVSRNNMTLSMIVT